MARDLSWTTPGAYEVAPGVYRIPLPLPNDGLRAVNVYALVGPAGLTLVDGGWALADAQQQLAAALGGLGLALADISAFLVTHAHRDHYTQAVALRRLHGSQVSIGKWERDNLAALRRAAISGRRSVASVARLRRAGAVAQADELERVTSRLAPETDFGPPDRWLADGECLEVPIGYLQVIATPGHTAGHVVYRDAVGGLLFAGDHVLPHITPSVGFEPAPSAQPLGNYLASLAAVRQLPDTLLLPAHGPVAPSVHARVDELLEHHDVRLAAVLRAVTAGASTAYEIARALRWTSRELRLEEFDLHNIALAITETLAHLDLLALCGAIRCQDGSDGVSRYCI